MPLNWYDYSKMLMKLRGTRIKPVVIRLTAAKIKDVANPLLLQGNPALLLFLVKFSQE